MSTSPNSIAADTSLFDLEAFQQQLAQTKTPVTLFRKTIEQAQQVLDDRFRAGEDIHALVTGRAWFMDQLLSQAWQQYFWPDPTGISLVAVGGYGRGELHPHSDVDLLILLRDDDATPYQDSLERFITFLWDIRLEIGHSVRSLTDCEREARADITVATNLMESRTLVGPEGLRQAMTQRLAPARMWPSDRFFEAKWQEQIARHYKYDNTEYSLEPNIKGAPGGLRDIQMIGWVAKRHFGLDTIDDLVAEGFLTQSELNILTQGQAFLWRVRYGLHMLAGRAEDRLLFDHQRALAELFGYTDTEERLAVEQFMKRYYREVMRLAELNDVLLQHFDEAILRAGELEEIRPLNKRFQIRNNYIETTHPKVFQYTPFALIEMFVLMAQNPDIEGVRAATIRLIRDHRHLIDEEFRNDLRNITLFMELLRSPGPVAQQLRRMTRYGVLGKYLPEFGYAIGLMQHDLFHIYTVDAHTLRLLQNLCDFQRAASKEEFPVASRVIHRLPKLELAYIAGLYHDIGKGRGGDHSELGAEDAVHFCQRHHLSKRDTRLVSWLVKNHLLMSMTAQKRDISDPDIIREFALKIRDQVHLDYLYILTVADITATNPNLWNGWRASLLHQLYTETKRALRRGLENPIDKQEWIEETQQEALEILAEKDIAPEQAWGIWHNLNDEYFLRDTAQEIAWHTEAIIGHGDSTEPLILVRETASGVEHEGGTQIFIYIGTRKRRFAATAATMEQLNLNILDARIITTESNVSLDTYIVLEDNGEPIGNNPARIEQIKRTLWEQLRVSHPKPEIVERHTPRQLKHFAIPTQVTISNDLLNQRTVLEVITPDRPGLLARIGRIFMEFDVFLQNAKIATLGERVEDVFFIVNHERQPISDPELCKELQERICSKLDEQAQA